MVFCLSMMPALKKLYQDKQQRIEAIRRHTSFYNTEPQLGAIVNGMVIGAGREAGQRGTDRR
ncbi:PTS system mannose-specific EIID component [Serratia fonticola]|uniref:PTS system mannose-specific EIID component n=1 Tax=Serratia fonticola TaxID=47917 RepID=A0A4U9W6Y8_SERFO|nr:PTS system mannose-specific EIID component [Serratia fonticola]